MADQDLLPHAQLHHAHHHLHRAAHAISQSNAAFLELAIPAAQQAETDTGVPSSITLAQACIESGWGHHHIGRANNYFGIKAPLIHGHRDLGQIAIGFVTAETKEYDANHELYVVESAFRQYASMADSFRDHGIWIRDNHRYAGVIFKYLDSGDADAVAEDLQRCGYAGLHNIVYASSLITMMKKHDFYKYNTTTPSSYQLRRTFI